MHDREQYQRDRNIEWARQQLLFRRAKLALILIAIVFALDVVDWAWPNTIKQALQPLKALFSALGFLALLPTVPRNNLSPIPILDRIPRTEADGGLIRCAARPEGSQRTRNRRKGYVPGSQAATPRDENASSNAAG
jgi:hypothetical protein